MAKRAKAKVKGGPKRTTRQEAQAQFHRKKQQQRMRQMRRRVGLTVAGVAFVSFLVASWRIEHSGALQQWAARVSGSAWQMTANAGFSVNQIYLTGRAHADAKVVKAALSVQPGDPILALPLAEMRAKLEAIPEVKSASISRQLPNKLVITLVERQPVAWWQHGDAHLLVDNDGVVLAKGNYPNINELPVLVGEDAPKHVREFTALLASEPSLQHDVVAGVRVGDRRWNVQLKREMTVMLPESSPDEAWHRFANLVRTQGLFTKAIRSVDMRLEDRVFIMPLEQQKSMITLTNARET